MTQQPIQVFHKMIVNKSVQNRLKMQKNFDTDQTFFNVFSKFELESI